MIFGALAVLTVVYTLFDPAESGFFPRCTFRMLTGLQCPGCGSQRAVHNLLNLNVAQAMRENILVVAAIPYLLFGFVLDTYPNPSGKMLKWRKRLFGRNAMYVILAVILVFWIGRNIS